MVRPKTPKVSIIDASKRPRLYQPRVMDKKPTWRVSQLETCDPYGWHVIDGKTAYDIRARLGSFESMTWQEILNAEGNPHHPIPVQDLLPTAQNRLRELRQDDIDELVSLRVTGAGRVWGIADGATLRLLWWDPEHKVCKSEKKNT